MTITDGFLKEVKQHLRVPHDLDDDLIKNEILVASETIVETLCLISKLTEGGTVNPDYPTSTDDLTSKQQLAVKHLTATFRQNPDDHLETKYVAYDKRLIERILGSELGYPGV